jgi:hypothetical protein
LDDAGTALVAEARHEMNSLNQENHTVVITYVSEENRTITGIASKRKKK